MKIILKWAGRKRCKLNSVYKEHTVDRMICSLLPVLLTKC